jgi:glycosyltransferase involved in cell wall biosynthesis
LADIISCQAISRLVFAIHLRYIIQPESLQLVVFGQLAPQAPPQLGFPVHYTGHLHDDLSLRALYSAADAMVIPSRQDNLPNTGLEAHACGTPVVAFNTGGLSDIVDDRVTGALAEPFEPASLAAVIRWVLEDPLRRRALGAAARERAERLWAPARMAGLYAEVYEEAIANALVHTHRWA